MAKAPMTNYTENKFFTLWGYFVTFYEIYVWVKSAASLEDGFLPSKVLAKQKYSPFLRLSCKGSYP